jgi:hypothetical protein
MKNYLITILLIGLVFTSCKKNENIDDTTQTGSQVTLPSGVAGAFYAMSITSIDEQSGVYDTTVLPGVITAWFTNSTQTLDAGNVTCNGYKLKLKDTAAGTVFTKPWYLGGSMNLNTTTLAHAQWVATGNATNNISSINYTDNASFATLNSFIVPVTASTSGYNISYSFGNTTTNDQFVYHVEGPNGELDGKLSGATGSLNITSAMISKVSASKENVFVQVAAVKVNTTTINGNLFAFVKQLHYEKSTYIN